MSNIVHIYSENKGANRYINENYPVAGVFDVSCFSLVPYNFLNLIVPGIDSTSS